ncbi:MAG: hypothetical protein R2879_00895 [Saprospiraceae bacterium]
MEKFWQISILVLFGFVSFPFKGFAQNAMTETNDSNLHLMVKKEGNEVVLRWAPSTAQFWEQSNVSGYQIEKMVLPESKDDLKNSNFEKITSNAILPAAPERWEQWIDSDNYAATAYAALYVERPENPGDLLQQLKTADDIRQKAFFLALLAADHSKLAADGLGLRFVDHFPGKGNRIIYRVFPSIPYEGTSRDTAYYLLDKSIAENAYKAPKPITYPMEKKVTIKWPKSSTVEFPFTSFFIERSNSPNGPFERLTEAPILNSKQKTTEDAFLYFIDSIGVNYQPFWYRLVGNTPFGESSNPGESTMGMGEDKTPPVAPFNLQAEVLGKNLVKLTWEVSKPIATDAVGYKIGKASTSQGPFSAVHDDLLPLTTQSFTHTLATETEDNYYAISIFDTAGNYSESFPVYAFFIDTFPPAPPTGLRGFTDTSGMVHLHWNRSMETDLLGYRLYWNNSPNHVFAMATGEIIKDTTFSMPFNGKTLSETVRFSLVAVDAGFGHSDFSAPIELERKDEVPPYPGRFTGWSLDSNYVLITWEPGVSKDIKSQELWKKIKNEKWELIAKLTKTVNSYRDENFITGSEVQYALKAIDDDNLVSDFSFPLGLHIEKTRELDPVQNVEAEWDENTKSILLNWKSDGNLKKQYVIYRTTREENWESYEVVEEQNRFQDNLIPAVDSIQYAVRVIDENGNQSLLSFSNKVDLK